MGTFAEDRASMDAAYATGTDQIAVQLDGRSPAPPPAPRPATASAAADPTTAPPADTGPGFWSRLGSGLASVGRNTVDLAKAAADRVEIVGSISAGRQNGLAAMAPPPPPPTPWGMILGLGAGLLVLLLALRR